MLSPLMFPSRHPAAARGRRGRRMRFFGAHYLWRRSGVSHPSGEPRPGVENPARRGGASGRSPAAGVRPGHPGGALGAAVVLSQGAVLDRTGGGDPQLRPDRPLIEWAPTGALGGWGGDPFWPPV